LMFLVFNVLELQKSYKGADRNLSAGGDATISIYSVVGYRLTVAPG